VPAQDDNIQQGTPRVERRAAHIALQEWLNAEASDSVETLLTTLHSIRRHIYAEFVDQLALPMNCYLRAQPQATFQHKNTLAKWLNAQLRALDLAIEEPATRMPGVLVADESKEGVSTFYIQATLPDGKKSRTNRMDRLPELRFTCRDAGLDKAALWQDRIERQGR